MLRATILRKRRFCPGVPQLHSKPRRRHAFVFFGRQHGSSQRKGAINQRPPAVRGGGDFERARACACQAQKTGVSERRGRSDGAGESLRYHTPAKPSNANRRSFPSDKSRWTIVRFSLSQRGALTGFRLISTNTSVCGVCVSKVCRYDVAVLSAMVYSV